MVGPAKVLIIGDFANLEDRVIQHLIERVGIEVVFDTVTEPVVFGRQFEQIWMDEFYETTTQPIYPKLNQKSPTGRKPGKPPLPHWFGSRRHY